MKNDCSAYSKKAEVLEWIETFELQKEIEDQWAFLHPFWSFYLKATPVILIVMIIFVYLYVWRK